MNSQVTLPAIQQWKAQGRKIVAVVAYDCRIAQIVDRAGVDLVSVGDSVGVNVWGHRTGSRRFAGARRPHARPGDR